MSICQKSPPFLSKFPPPCPKKNETTVILMIFLGQNDDDIALVFFVVDFQAKIHSCQDVFPQTFAKNSHEIMANFTFFVILSKNSDESSVHIFRHFGKFWSFARFFGVWVGGGIGAGVRV